MTDRLDTISLHPVQVHIEPAANGNHVGPTPLTPSQRAQADDVARRLCLELRGLLELVSPDERGASAMGRWLQMDRNTCQRIVAATAGSSVDAATLAQLPGVMGLRQFVEAMGRKFPGGEAATAMAGVGAATTRFEKLIDDFGGSQRKLRERLELERERGDADLTAQADNLESRRAMFRAAVDIVGRWSESRVIIRIIRPVPGDPLHTENIQVNGHVGHMSRPVGVPLEIFSATPEGPVESSDPAFESLSAGRPEDVAHRSLMQRFCTQPLPRVTSRVTGTRVVHAIDEAATPGQPSDIFVADRRLGRDRHPATQHPPIGETSTIMNFPARRFVMDVYLHRDVARLCIPCLEVHLSRPSSMVLSRWSTRLPGGPRLELLGLGIDQAATDAYARYQEVAREIFDSAGWDPSEFVGYRCDVAYPIWRAAYCMLFDFTGNELPARNGAAERS